MAADVGVLRMRCHTSRSDMALLCRHGRAEDLAELQLWWPHSDILIINEGRCKVKAKTTKTKTWSRTTPEKVSPKGSG